MSRTPINFPAFNPKLSQSNQKTILSIWHQLTLMKRKLNQDCRSVLSTKEISIKSMNRKIMMGKLYYYPSDLKTIKENSAVNRLSTNTEAKRMNISSRNLTNKPISDLRLSNRLTKSRTVPLKKFKFRRLKLPDQLLIKFERNLLGTTCLGWSNNRPV